MDTEMEETEMSMEMEMEKEMEMEITEEMVDIMGAMEDCKMILSQINKQSRESRIKRRWLMHMEFNKHDSAKLKRLLPPEDGFLPDSFLRQDDVYCEFLKNPILAFSGESTHSNHYRAAAGKILDDINNFPVQALASMYRKLKGVNGYTPQIQTRRCKWSHGSLVGQVRKKCMKFLSELGDEGSLQLPLANALAVASLTVKLKSRSALPTEFRKFSPEIVALQNDIMKAVWLLEDEKKLSFTEVKDILLLLDPNAQTNKRIRIALRKLMTEYLFECADMDSIPECLREALSFIDKRTEKVSRHRFSKEDIGTEVEGLLAVSSQAKQIIWDFLPEHENDIDIEFANAYQDDKLETDDDYFSDDGLKEATSPYSDDLYNQIEGFGESRPNCLTSPSNGEDKEDSTESGIKNVDELESLGDSEPRLLSSCSERQVDGCIILENKYLAIQKSCDNSSTVAYHLIGGLLTKFAEVEGIDLDQDDLSYLESNGTGSSESEVLSRKNVDNYGSLVHILEEQIRNKRMPSLSGNSMETLKKIMKS